MNWFINLIPAKGKYDNINLGLSNKCGMIVAVMMAKQGKGADEWGSDTASRHAGEGDAIDFDSTQRRTKKKTMDPKRT